MRNRLAGETEDADCGRLLIGAHAGANVLGIGARVARLTQVVRAISGDDIGPPGKMGQGTAKR